MAINLFDAIGRISLDTGAFNKNFDSVMAKSRKIGMAMTAMGGVIVGALALSVKKSADFEQSITNAASVTGKAGEEFEVAREKMAALAKELGVRTPWSAAQAAEAMYDLASKGFDVAAMSIDDLIPLLDLATATQSDLTVATETATSTLRAFGFENEEMIRIADVFTKVIGSSAATMDKLGYSMTYVAPLAKAAGVTFEETSAALGKLFDRGMDGSMAGTALRKVFAELMAPGENLTDILERLGLGIEDVDLQTQSLEDVMRTLKGAGLTASDAMEAFGQRAGPAAISLLGLGEAGDEAIDTFAKLAEKLENAGGAAGTTAAQQMQTLSGRLKELSSAFEALQLVAGEVFLPMLTKLAEKITPILRDMSAWVKLNPNLTEKIILMSGAVGGLMLVLGPLLIALPGIVLAFKGLAVVIGLASPLYLALGFLVTALGLVTAELLLQKDYINPLIDRYFPLLAQTIDNVADDIVYAFNRIGDAWDVMIDKLSHPLSSAQEWLGSVTDSLRGIPDFNYSSTSSSFTPRNSESGGNDSAQSRATNNTSNMGGVTIHVNGAGNPKAVAEEVAKAMVEVQRRGIGNAGFALGAP